MAGFNDGYTESNTNEVNHRKSFDADVQQITQCKYDKWLLLGFEELRVSRPNVGRRVAAYNHRIT